MTKIEGDRDVDMPWDLHGMFTGSVNVRAGGDFKLHGMIVRDLVVHPGGSAVVHGMVCGSVVNLGGLLEIHGMIIGAVRTEAGETHVDPRAVIRNHE